MERIKLDDAQGFIIYGPKGEEIYGVFTNGRVKEEEVPDGAHRYELREGDDGNICTLETHVTVNHAGTVLTSEPIDFGELDRLEFPAYGEAGEELGGGNGWDYSFDDEVLDEIDFLDEEIER